MPRVVDECPPQIQLNALLLILDFSTIFDLNPNIFHLFVFVAFHCRLNEHRHRIHVCLELKFNKYAVK